MKPSTTKRGTSALAMPALSRRTASIAANTVAAITNLSITRLSGASSAIPTLAAANDAPHSRDTLSSAAYIFMGCFSSIGNSSGVANLDRFVLY